MDVEVDHRYFQCELIEERDKSYKLRIHSADRVVFAPKSLCVLKPDGARLILEIEAWWADKNDL